MRTAWIVRDDWRHLFFGYLHTKGQPLSGTCRYAHAPGVTRECETTSAVSDAVQLRDRSVVLAAGGWLGSGGLPRPGPDQLVLRHLDGSEVTVGQASTVGGGVPNTQLTVEPDGTTVWAATPLGLQRLATSAP